MEALGNGALGIDSSEIKRSPAHTPNPADASNKIRTDDKALNCAPARSLLSINNRTLL